MENTNEPITESYSKYEVPPEIKRWNWGAASFNILWGFGNKCYLPLLSFIPIFNIIWFFVCGFKGNSWAWKKGNYKNVEEFMLVQKTWNRAGIAYLILTVIIVVIYALLATLFLD